MYTLNGIVYAGEKTEDIEVIAVKALPYQMLLLTFSTGEKRLFDATILKGAAFKPLSDEKVFQSVKVTYGFVSWMNGEIDCAPEYMYDNSFVYNEELVG